MIAAICNSRGIGIDNKLPWNLPEDMKFFKENTIGKNILMGSKTFLSIGRPLPKRVSWVLTRYPDSFVKIPRVNFIKSEDEIPCDILKDVIVIGGEQMYKKFLKKVDTIYLTLVQEDFECDTFFPETPGFNLYEEGDELVSKNGLKYKFITLIRCHYHSESHIL